MSRRAARTARRVLLVVIDGLGAESLRSAIASGGAPTIARIAADFGPVRDAVSPFPSLTPVCLSTIVTGAGPDRHRIPSLSWYHRGQHRFVEYGSSVSAARVEGTRTLIEDVILNLNHVHLADEPQTLFEDLQDRGVEAGSINFLIWRGRTRHTMKHDYGPVARIAKRTKVHAVYGPDHLYFGELYGKRRPLIPQVGIKRPKDWSAAHVARWLLRNTPTQFLLLYLGQHDAASHKLGPESTQRAIRIADRAVRRVVDGLGGIEKFVEEFSLILCADHGQTLIEEHARIEEVFDDVALFGGRKSSAADDSEIAISPSNRCALIYRIGESAPPASWIAKRALEAPSVDIVAHAEEGQLVVRRGEGVLRVRRDDERGLPTVRSANRPDVHDQWSIEGDLEVLDIAISDGMIDYGEYPDALLRIDQAVRCINAGDVVVSATPGYEYVDIGGGCHTGGSHGSLHATDSLAPLLTIGFDEANQFELPIVRLSDIAPAVRRHFDVGVHT